LFQFLHNQKLKKQFLLNKDYSTATADKIFSNDKNTQVLTCNETCSCWIENKGNGKFEMHILPMEAQFAPVNAIVCTDVDGDGIKDILLAGNEYQTEVMTGRYDASYGCFLKGNKQKQFKAVSTELSGFKIDDDVKDMKIITTANNKRLLFVAINNDYLRVFEIK